ncbi:HesA/MoeB/ThiF family protein [Caldiplasma sukawensis]
MEKIALIGAGATGNGILQSLLIKNKKVTLIDGDVVEKRNMKRQPLFSKDDIGKKKVDVLKRFAEKSFGMDVETYDCYIDSGNIEILSEFDVIYDGTDSFKTRNLINEFAVKNSIRWIMCSTSSNFSEIKIIEPEKTSCLNCITHGRNLIPVGCDNENETLMIPYITGQFAVNYYEKWIGEDELLFINFNKMMIDHINLSIDKKCEICMNFQFSFLNKNKIYGRQYI